MKEKLQAVKEAMKSIEKQFGKGAIMLLNDKQQQSVPCVPSGSISLDRALGGKGYPKGRIVEIFGPESSGKTTLTLHLIAECQKSGGVTAFVDAEHALDLAYAEKLGVKADQLLVSQPDTGEQALEITETLVRSGAVDLVVIDSVAALVPQAEIEGNMGDSHMALQARLMSQALRKLTGVAFRTGTLIVFINQLRSKIGVTFGSPETTTGGNALKFYCSVRLDIRRIGQVKSGDELIGNRTRVKVVKNKLAPPFQTAEVDIRYGSGVDYIGDVIDLAVSADIIQRSGAYYSFDGSTLAQGREKTREALQSNPKLLAKITARLVKPEGGTSPADTNQSKTPKAA